MTSPGVILSDGVAADALARPARGAPMMQKIQRFGGAMFTPVLLFAFAGVVVGVGTLCTTEAAIGPIAAEGTLWRKC